jgi:hypothetical protein
MRKFRFMERLVDRTPATSERLSPESIERAGRATARAEAERWGDPDEILAEYLAARSRRTADVAEVEKAFGKPFHRFGPKDYARFLDGVDLEKDEDLRTWSHVTHIPILAVRKNSGFFYVNLHLLKDGRLADRLRRARIKTEYDAEVGALTLRDSEGGPLAIRDVPEGIIRPTGRTGRFWHLKDFSEDRVVLEALKPYLVRLGDLGHRPEIDSWIRSLPLSIVQVFRGKGIYFTTKTGRSYAVGMPCSNAVYKIFVGLQTGVFVDSRRDGADGTRQNFVHEIGHLVDYAVLKGGYGNYRHPLQFPGFRKLMPEKERLFGKGDDKVPQTLFGYVSRYARANAQESFAEHFRAFVLERERFLELARKESAEGHPELMAKYRFMEKLVERTPTTLRRLSAGFLEMEERWTGLSSQLARLLRARDDLGDAAPAGLARLIESRLSAAFRNDRDRKAEAASYGKALATTVREVARLRDRGRRDRALADLLGVTLSVEFRRDATSRNPGVVAKIRGADEGEVTGAVSLDVRPAASRRAEEPRPIRLDAGAATEIAWSPDVGDGDAPFVVTVTADLRWGTRRLGLTKEIVGRPSIPVWSVVGPFDNPGGATADLAHPPETERVHPKRTFEGQGGLTVTWKEVRRDPESRPGSEFVVDLDSLLGEGENAAAYLAVWVESRRSTDAVFSFGSADGAVVWVDGKRVGGWLKGRRDHASRANALPVRLKRGRNEILVKVTVTGRGWRFSAHLTDPDGRPLDGVRFDPPR